MSSFFIICLKKNTLLISDLKEEACKYIKQNKTEKVSLTVRKNITDTSIWKNNFTQNDQYDQDYWVP